MEDLLKLESDHTLNSREVASKIQERLRGARDPSLLGELVDFYFKTYSKRARKILTTLREAHSQDFFNKLNDCILNQNVLPVFKLLAHTLNSQQTNWLYRIVDHPLFSSILQQLEESDDVMVLSMAVLVVAAILPSVPTYIGVHLHHLFQIFCELATIKTTNRLGLTPHELVLHLDVCIYYLFLQLYALFPCNLFSFFKRYCHGASRAQINAFQEFITPLFYQVQLHPGLVTDSCTYELSKGKWGAMEPSDIATLSLQFCLDTLFSCTEKKDIESQCMKCLDCQSTTPIVSSPRPNTLTLTPSPKPKPQVIKVSTGDPLEENATPPYFFSVPDTSIPQVKSSPPSDQSVQLTISSGEPLVSSGPPNPGGLKTSEEINQFWSPSVSLGQIVIPNSQAHSDSTSHRSSRNSMTRLSQPSHQYSNLSSPNSDSALSSTLHTPGPVPPSGVPSAASSVFIYKNYSPTASVDGESLFGRQMAQSAIHAPSRLDESFGNGQLDPLSQSMRVESHLTASPVRGVRNRVSIRDKLGRIFGIFKKEVDGSADLTQVDQEDYVEVAFSSPSRGYVGEIREEEEVGEECEMTLSSSGKEAKGNSELEVEGSESDSSPVDNHRRSGLEGIGQQLSTMDAIEIDISNLPLSTRVSRSDSESSAHQLNFKDMDKGTPNTAGMGLFESMDAGNLYKDIGASAVDEVEQQHISSSYPRSKVSAVAAKRIHTSNSETEITHHALQIQERLQKLVEHKENANSADTSNESVLGSHTPVVESSSNQEALSIQRQHPIKLNELTLSGPVQSPYPSNTEAAEVPSPFPAGLSPLGNSHPTRLTMRRVSVCSRKGLGNRFTSESSGDGTTVSMDPPEPSLITNTHPSPLALLDQFVSCGEVLHRGGLDTLPLTEQKGVDWNHFGGCPHSEEFRIMQSQVILLHSQLLFERHQCIQHAKRNRRLLSKARTATHVAEKLVSLRDQLLQQEALVSSLREQLKRVSEGQGAQQQALGSGEARLIQENSMLKDDNARLTEELRQIKERSRRLEEELKSSNGKVFNLENERQHLEPRLQRAEQVHLEMESLSREFHLLGEICQQQKDQIISLQSQSQHSWEWRTKCALLHKEKEEGLRKIHGLEQALGACQARLKELEREGSCKELEISELRVHLEEERACAWNKMKALEEKYASMKIISQQLESHIMELKGRAPLHRRKTRGSKHHRNPSATSITTNTPSPITT